MNYDIEYFRNYMRTIKYGNRIIIASDHANTLIENADEHESIDIIRSYQCASCIDINDNYFKREYQACSDALLRVDSLCRVGSGRIHVTYGQSFDVPVVMFGLFKNRELMAYLRYAVHSANGKYMAMEAIYTLPKYRNRGLMSELIRFTKDDLIDELTEQLYARGAIRHSRVRTLAEVERSSIIRFLTKNGIEKHEHNQALEDLAHMDPHTGRWSLIQSEITNQQKVSV